MGWRDGAPHSVPGAALQDCSHSCAPGPAPSHLLPRDTGAWQLSHNSFGSTAPHVGLPQAALNSVKPLANTGD